MTEAEPRPAEAMINILTGGWRAQCVYAAAKMRIPELIESGAASDVELATRTGASEERIRRLMRLLVAMGVFEGDGRGAYLNTTLSEMLMEKEESLRDMVLFCGEEFHKAWGHACASFLSGKSGFLIESRFEFYEFLRRNPEAARRFSLAMKANNIIFSQIPSLIDLKSKHIVDIGGAHGDLIKNIILTEPSVTATLLDRENMLGVARDNLKQYIDNHKVKLVDSDMHNAIPTDGDIYFICRVISDIGDDETVELFRKCRKSMKKDGQVIVIERMIPSVDVAQMTLLWDLHLSIIANGRYRSTEEIEELLRRGGLTIERVVGLPMDTFFVVAAATPES